MARPLDRPGTIEVIRSGLLILLLGLLLLSPQTAPCQTGGRLAGLVASGTLSLKAAFNFSPLYPVAGQMIHFEDASIGNIISWKWDFGDGFISARQSTYHSFDAAGFKRVTLTVKSSTESRTMTKTITVVPSAAASFTYAPSVPAPGQLIQFKDSTSGTPTAWKWTFGDGGTSAQQNPQHTYAKAGSYNVTLVATEGSASRTASRTIAVASMSTLSSSFTFTPASPVVGQVIQFRDTSTGSPTSWLWNFGDGATSAAQNPTHAYASAGAKTVTLTATNGTTSKTSTRTVTITAPRTAAFTYDPAAPTAGQKVQFTDLSTFTPQAWSWNFGDGATSSAHNPSHVFAAGGSYGVQLTVTDSVGSLSVKQTVTVTAASGLVAKFTYSPAVPAAGQAVQFTDTSTGNPTSWLWDFNDGSQSSSPNPSHVFAGAGHHNVSLTVSNASGSASASASVTVGSGDGSTGAYWVSPTGSAAWGSARSETPLEGAACCSLATANASAAAGDTVYLRGGTYAVGIKPDNSGAAGRVILFMAYPGEVPMFRVAAARAITLVGKSYVKVDGIHSSESQAFFFIGYGASYNEITNCVFDRSSGQYSVGLITAYNTAFTAQAPADHNWVHHNVFSRYGRISSTGNDFGTVRISGGRSDTSSHNTFEDNVFFHGGHDNLDVGASYNVIRNNVFHNEEAYYADTARTFKNAPVSGYFGNRNIILTNYGDGPGTAQHTLIEGNRIGYAGTPPDDDGAMGVENAGLHTVVRYNDIFGNGASGYYSKMQGVKSGSWARVYNNTIYANGFGDPSLGTGFKYGVTIWSYRDHNDWPENVVVKNNIVYGNRAEWKVGTDNILPQVVYENNVNADPGFINPDLSDKSVGDRPDFRLGEGSPAIDAGGALTLAKGGGTGSTVLVVGDARLFQDGTWGSALTHGVTHFPDWIAVGAVTNIVKVAAIDYATNTITLASPLTWSDAAKIWLYSDSNGRRVLLGNAPDAGAHER